MTGRLVLCLDGTWNSVFKTQARDGETTVLKPANPLKLARSILPIDPVSGTRQITYYDSGVGALGLYPGVSNKLLNFADSKLGGGWGAGFEANVEQAVTFISNNHAEGEPVFVFGFSRGAAQARALTHFISWMGGVPEKDDAYYIPLFFRHYLLHQGGGSARDIKTDKGHVVADRLRKVEIAFLGVWDTVSALGARFRASATTAVADKAFHTRPYPADCVTHAYHAIAIDEQRFDFRPEIWTHSLPGQTMVQNWFAGAHGNVGGSYDHDGMANCALHWIVEAAKAQGLAVDDAFLEFYRAYPQDQIGDPYDKTFKAIELLRFKLGKGKRPMEGYPATANLDIHPSAVERLCSDPSEHKRMKEHYRPADLVAIARAHANDKDGFLHRFGLLDRGFVFPGDI
ncbi:MAG: DUF2235 domain-containing protein [Pseudomonadota bacterium]